MKVWLLPYEDENAEVLNGKYRFLLATMDVKLSRASLRVPPLYIMRCQGSVLDP